MLCFQAVALAHLMRFSSRQVGELKTSVVQAQRATLELPELWVEHREAGSLWGSFVP